MVPGYLGKEYPFILFHHKSVCGFILAVMKFHIQEAFLQTFSGSNFYSQHTTYLKQGIIENIKCISASDFKFSHEQNFRTKCCKIYV